MLAVTHKTFVIPSPFGKPGVNSARNLTATKAGASEILRLHFVSLRMTNAVVPFYSHFILNSPFSILN